MLELHFTGPMGSEIRVGPAEFFRIEGATILQGPALEAVARLTENNQWNVRGLLFARYDANQPIQVCLIGEDEQRGKGPFDALFAVGPVQYANDRPLARFDHEDRCWHEVISQRCWPALLLRPTARLR